MNQTITITLSEKALERATNLASVVARPLEKVLAEALEIALPDIGSEVLPPVSILSDEEVLALSHARMEPSEDTLLSRFLEKQQAGSLNKEEGDALNSLFQTYLRLWLRQSEALVEAVKRGLRKPLSQTV